MTRDRDPQPEGRARRILERLTGSSRSLDESLSSTGADLEASELAERLGDIERLFLMHGGERDSSFGPSKDEVLFEWGHLQVLEPLGEGSFGEVFRAYDRTLDRDVALKLLKTDQAHPFQSQLFLHEARQLAMVRHRHVLAVHGAAVHDGRPGLWTDLIEGETAHADLLRPLFTDADEVLELVESLVLAVQAVHNAGLVHGDIKPSNLMRDANGDWVLMDFGASRAAQSGGSGPSLTSGTPLYMAPEVVLGDTPDLRADRYSIGATLYRVLTGTPPFEVGQWGELRALHQNGERPDPARLAADAGGRVARLIDRLMDPDPDRRIGADDVLAEVHDIRAAPHRRFRRMALGSIAGVLLIGLTLTSIGFYRANEALQVAEVERQNTFAVNEFLQHLLFTPSSSGRGNDLTVQDMLREAGANLERRLADQPEARIIVRRVLASSYHATNQTDLAAEQVRIARAELQAEGLRMPSIERKLALVEMLVAMRERRWEDVITLAEAFLARFADELGDDHVDVRFARGYLLDSYNALGRLDEAEALLDEYFTEVPAPETAVNNTGANILRNRTNLYGAQGRFDEALAAAEQAVDWLERFPEAAQNDRTDALSNLAISLLRVNELERAVEVFAELVPLQERIYGPGTNMHAAALSNLASAQFDAGRPDDSLASLQTALDAIEENPGRVSEQQRLIVMFNFATALNAIGEQDRGEAMLRETHEGAQDLLGPSARLTLALKYNLAELLSQQERFDEARTLAEQALEDNIGAFGEDHYMTLLAQDNLAVAMAGLGRGSEARALHDEALSGLNDQLGAEHPYVLVVERNRLKTRQGFAPEQVEPEAVSELVRRHEQVLGENHPDTLKARALLEG